MNKYCVCGAFGLLQGRCDNLYTRCPISYFRMTDICIQIIALCSSSASFKL